MTSRMKLKQNIIRAWHDTMEEAYSKRLINSERGLQVHFCHRLFESFLDLDIERHTFVEPRFKTPDGKILIPDLVICNQNRIIGVIELKYAPRGLPGYEKDLNTLRWFAEEQEVIEVAHERFRGVDDHKAKSYKLAPDAVLCWGGVYGGKQMLDVEKRGAEMGLGRRFLSLHAVTARGQAPDVFPK